MSIRTYFENISDAIREKTESADTYTPEEMPSAIRSIPSGSSTAGGVTYDNTASGLTANNVQDAIDELAEDVSTINSDLSELNSVVSGTTFAELKTAILALSDKEFIHSSVCINDVFVLTPGTKTSAIRGYKMFSNNSTNSIVYDCVIVNTSENGVRTYTKNVNGSSSDVFITLTSWELYYIKDI